jgi:hypothetical protein
MTMRKVLLLLLPCCLALNVLGLGILALRPEGSPLEETSTTILVCSICGEEKREASIHGVTCRSELRETELSNWYRDVGMKPHSHRWETTYWRVTYGNGTYFSPSFDGCETLPLDLLRDALKKVDRATGEGLKRQYSAAQSDETAMRCFTERCWKILRSDKAEKK